MIREPVPLHEDVDAARWAREFVALHGGDEGLMLAWFANAIMAGYDTAMRRVEQSATEPDRALNAQEGGPPRVTCEDDHAAEREAVRVLEECLTAGTVRDDSTIAGAYTDAEAVLEAVLDKLAALRAEGSS